MNKRPYRDIPTQHKPVEWGTIIILALLLIAILVAIWTRPERTRPQERTLSPVEKAEHDRLLRLHGLNGFSVVLVKDSGKFFVRDGKVVRFR